MIQNQMRPALIELDSDDELVPRKRRKTGITTSSHHSKLSLLHAAVSRAIMAEEKGRALNNKPPATSYILPPPTSVLVHSVYSAGASGIRIQPRFLVGLNVDNKKDLCRLLKTHRPPAQKTLHGSQKAPPEEFKSTLKALGPLPAGQPLFAPPCLPQLKLGQGIKRPTRR